MPRMQSAAKPSGVASRASAYVVSAPISKPPSERGAGALELGQAADVDERPGRSQSQLHQRQQAHPAREDLGVPTGERGERVVQRGRSPVCECRGDHAWPPFASWIADQTFSEV